MNLAVVSGLSATIMFFVVSGYIVFHNIRTFQENNINIIRSHDAILALGDLQSAAQDAETGQRGFLLTNDAMYLAPYEAAKASMAAKIENVAELVRDNPIQYARLEPLKGEISAKMAELQETIDLRRSSGSAAALAVVVSNRGKAAMDVIRAQITAMDDYETALRTQRLAEMQSAYKSAILSSLLSTGLGVILALIVGLLVRRDLLTRERLNWLQAGQVGLASAMMGEQSAARLGDSVLSFFGRYLGAHAGAAYLGVGEKFERVSTYGVPADAEIPERFGPGDGLLGQAVLDGRTLLIEGAPEGYLVFGSALGRHGPTHLVISPARTDGVVNAVVELGFLHQLEGSALALLEQTSESVSTAFRSARFRSDLQKLVEETQRQSEEMQVQSEELRVTNEELEEQARALTESRLQLEQSQIGIEQTNTQLEEQALQLAAQRDDLERVNVAIQIKAQEVEQASRYKTDFLANMSHELRTPLNSLLILSKLLADNKQDNLTEEQIKYATTIYSSGNDLQNLINDILDLSKIEAGRIEIQFKAVRLKRIKQNLRELFQPIALEKGITFAIEIAPDCPEEIETDGQRLEQILKNLLSNALKFTERGKVELAIARFGEAAISFSVSDSGIGIADEDQQSVFEAFRQADGTISRKYGGTGLGLSISRQLARLLGGEIQLQSKTGEGSRFTLVMPTAYDPTQSKSPTDPPRTELEAPIAAMKPGSAELPAPPRSEVQDDRETLSAGQRLLLLVEDDDAFAQILRDLAHEMGFQALVAGTGEEALRLAKQFMPNAIVLDVGLPDQSGLTVLDRLKREIETRHIPIHVVSGSDHAQTALSLGAVGHLLKPVKREDLTDVLKKLEDKFSQRMHRVLVVEDDAVQREAIGKLLSLQDVETVGVGTAAECLERLKEQTFDCMVLDLSLPDATGYSLLETLSRDEAYAFPPVIVYTGRDLSSHDEQMLRRFSKSIIIKGAKSPERLLDEVTLFLHQVVQDLPSEQQRMIRKARNRDEILEHRRILIVEDDVRNIYALSNILEPRGATIDIARNGLEALDALEKSQRDPSLKIDLVLMDVMMPVMDGLTAMREIRKQSAFKKLAMIALTAKAMPDDQQRCIDAGASDYISKPLDVEKLLSLVRVWMPR